MTSSVVEAPGTAPVKPKARRALLAAAMVLIVCLAAILGFIGGEHHRPGMTVLSGVAHVGIDEATVTVNGWAYGIDGAGNVTWVDDQGSVHQDGWPSCLRPVGASVSITFGEMPVATDGLSWRQVVWVDCQPSSAN